MKKDLLFARLIFLLFIIIGFKNVAAGQVNKLPRNATNQNKLPVDAKPVIKQDTSKKYVAVTPVVTTTARIATADELFMGRGEFLIRTARDYKYLIQHTDFSHTSLLWEYANDPRQMWNFILQADGKYKIKNGNGECLQWGGAVSFYVISKPESADAKQLWQMEYASHGNFYLKASNGKYLGIYSDAISNGNPVTIRDKESAGHNQKWHLIKMSNDNRRVTSFIPETHGFRFVNTFRGEDGLRWGGLCGGMVYAALDYFNNRIPIPIQSYTPANRTTLQSYLYERQQHSMWNVNERWSELEVSYNTRAGEIFRWGIQGHGGGRLEELKNAIDGGRSVPIGLFVGGVKSANGKEYGNHVVLAVGYTMGRYTGNFEGYPGDYKILAYDPNQRNRMMTIVPNVAGECYFEVETGKVWRTYFVNNKYDNEHVPPRDIASFPEREPEGSIRHLYAWFLTGGDDLRGNNDNVSITVQYTDGTSQLFQNVNNGARWVDNTEQTVHLELNRPVRKTDIRGFMLTTSFGNDMFSDDWNLDGFQVTTGWGGIVFAESFAPEGQYIFRFSGDERRQRHMIRVQ